MFTFVQSKSRRFVSTFFYTVYAFVVFTFVDARAVVAQEARSNAKNQFNSIARIHKYTAQGRVYFVPITSATFVPISTDTIKKSAGKVFLLNSYDLTILYRIIGEKPGVGTFDAKSFYRVINEKKKTGSFDNNNVRLRLDDGQQPPLFIDQQGVVLYGRIEYNLTPLAFVELDHFIASLSNKK